MGRKEKSQIYSLTYLKTQLLLALMDKVTTIATVKRTHKSGGKALPSRSVRCEMMNRRAMYNSVKAIFVLAGTIDERNFHLQALSAIAQIVNTPDFEEKWLKAKTVQHLKDLIFFSERRRVE